MGTVRKSIGYSSLNGWTGVAFQLVSTVVVARILTPEQTGVFAVAAVFASLASTFRDFGVGEYLIQERELTDDAIRAATTVNIAVSWAMAALLLLIAPWVAQFYRSDGVGNVMRVQAINFVLIPFGAVAMAWFRRELNFQPIFFANVIASTVSLVVVLSLATTGHGYMSLAWSSVAGVAVTVAASLYFRPKTFPRWPGLRGVREVVAFGKFVSGIYIFGQLGRGAPEMVIGRAHDMASVGMFSRANGMVEIFHSLVLRSIMPVCLPYFARSVRERGSPVRGLVTTMSYLTVVGWPFLAFMALTAYAVIRLMYGEQWLAAVSLSRLLCAAAAFELVYFPAKEAMLSVGRGKESNALQMLIQGFRLLGLLAAVPFGLNGAAWGLLIAAAFGLLASHLFLARTIGLGVAEIMRALRPSAGVTVLAMAPLCVLTVLVPIGVDNYLWVAGAGAVITAVCWLGSLRLLQHPLWPEIMQLQRGALTWVRRRMAGPPPAA